MGFRTDEDVRSAGMGIGLLFPGQASQFAGMGKDLHDAFPAARAVFEEASEAAGMDIASLCFRGSDEELRLTENTQPAIFTVSVAAFRVLAQETGIRPVCAAGHSLGEYSALVAAGVLPLSGAARVLRSRGRYMQEAVKVGDGGMAAIIGLSLEGVEAACRSGSSKGVVEPANFNGGDQIVISGGTEAVSSACEFARSLGAKRVLPLPVSAPFHCSLMQPAADRLAPELLALPLGPFGFPVIANVTAEPHDTVTGVPGSLIRQIVAPVRWEESIRRMRKMGVAAFLEVGPGKVLSGIVRRIDKTAYTASYCAYGDLDAIRALSL